ncbi:MAG: hypothetical protein B7Y02_00570 [Rhodobacterales bacterium 17-64-5]|nr:MAG: hypothetical protein B7Y02_00570 [Rhodobacterales bacterium 17-64-5]
MTLYPALLFLPPAAETGMAAMTVGREGGADFGHDLSEGQPVDSGEDECLQFGVALDLAGASGSVGAAVGGLDFFAG